MRKYFIAFVVFALTQTSSFAVADELPMWEAGFGFTGLSLPDYRGSNEKRGYVLPFPYVVYRGDILKWDRKGLRGLLFQSNRVELNISADAGVPVNSGRNSARTGMPYLDPTLQIGPSLEICLVRDCDAERVVQLRFPVRAVFATDFSYISGTGYVINPQLNFDFENIGSPGGWNFGFAFGPLYATKRHHEYYYEVAPPYAIPGVRPAYDPPGGYSGSLFVMALSRRFDHIWFGAFCRYDDLSGAVFRDSPLVKTRRSLMAGFGLAWVIGQSKILVQASP
jgi:outer membrane scaffolding protein for murein synthesis (MipA/OmpV family)